MINCNFNLKLIFNNRFMHPYPEDPNEVPNGIFSDINQVLR